MKSRGKEGSFQIQPARGGFRPILLKLTDEEGNAGHKKRLEVMGLGVAGVDMLQSA